MSTEAAVVSSTEEEGARQESEEIVEVTETKEPNDIEPVDIEQVDIEPVDIEPVDLPPSENDMSDMREENDVAQPPPVESSQPTVAVAS